MTEFEKQQMVRKLREFWHQTVRMAKGVSRLQRRILKPLLPTPGYQYNVGAEGFADTALVYAVTADLEVVVEHSDGEMWTYTLVEWLEMQPEFIR